MDRARPPSPIDIAPALIAGSPDGIIAFDRELRYTLWNPAMERISGMPAHAVVGRSAVELFPFLVETGEIEHFRSALRGEYAVSREQRFRIPETGSFGFYDGHYLPVIDDGVVVGGVAVIRNVTGRHRNQMRTAAQLGVSRVLAESDAEDAPALILAAIGETTEWGCGGYWEVDAAGERLHCEVTWRADAADFESYDRVSRGSSFRRGEGLPGRCWETLEAIWIEDILEDARYRASSMAAGEKLRSAVAFPIRVGGKAIGVMEFFARRPAERDGELLRLLEDLGTQFGQFVERKRVEGSQQRQVEEMRTLLDTLPVGVLIAHDPQCGLVTGNRIANRLMRIERDANVSKTPSDGAAAPGYRAYRDGTELPLEELPLRRALAGRPVENMEYQLRFEDGGRIDLLVSATALLDRRGAIRGAVATLLDVTEQKRAQQALQEEDRRKTEFIATLAHELRNPLAPIRNAVQILQMREASEEARAVHAIIERQLRHMVRLVDDLLDVSRITRGKLELRRERVTVQALVAQALEAARPGIDREGHRLEVSLPDEPAWLQGDTVRLVQAVLNLLTNATKYTPRAGRIRLRVEIQGDEVVMRVTDTGIGMNAEELARAFDMFWQAGDALDRSQGGLGIGLSLARTVAELHGGRLEGRSEGPGRGSEFELRLPLDR